jgi:hypothetical protein
LGWDRHDDSRPAVRDAYYYYDFDRGAPGFARGVACSLGNVCDADDLANLC